MKQRLINAAKAHAPLLIVFGLCAVSAYAQMPLDRYSSQADSITTSTLLRRIAGIAVALLGLGFAMRAHDVNKAAVVGVTFGVGVLLNADTIIGWLS